MNKPLAIDLCCGRGGWTRGLLAAGFSVIGVDIKEFPNYPAPMFLADVRKWKPPAGVKLILASPPCEQFSRHTMPWTRRKNPPPPDKSLWLACERIAKECRAPIVIENVRGAQQFMGKSVRSWGSFHLWGDVPPVLPAVKHKPKEMFGSKQREERAEIPEALAFAIASLFYWKLVGS